MYRKFTKDILKIFFLYFLTVVLVNILIYHFVDLIPKVERKEFLNKLIYFDQTTKNYDGVFWGSSKIKTQVDPERFFNNTNIWTFNLGVGGNTEPIGAQLLDYSFEIFKRKGIKYLFLELYQFDYRIHIIDKEFYYYGVPLLHILEGLLFYKHKVIFSDWIDLVRASFYKYTRAPRLVFYKNKMVLLKSMKLKEFRHGYFSLQDNIKKDPVLQNRRENFLKKMKIFNFDPEVRPSIKGNFRTRFYQNYLSGVLKKYSDAGIEVILIISPTNRKKQIFWQLQDFLKQETYLLWDLSDKKVYPEIYSTDLFFDSQHLNDEGSALYTDILSRLFLERHQTL